MTTTQINSSHTARKFAARGVGVLGLFALSFGPISASAQSTPPQPAPSSNHSGAAQTASAAPAPFTGSKAANPYLQQMLKEHAVITTDDLEAMHSGFAIVFVPMKFSDPPAVDPASCDTDCEAEARAAVGMGTSQQGDWQAQFSVARLDMSGDKEWRETYLDGLQKAHQYCIFQDQQMKWPPSGRDDHPGYERAKWEQYVTDMNRVLGEDMDSAVARIQLEIQRAQKIDLVRAAMMEVLAERAFNQCPSAPGQ